MRAARFFHTIVVIGTGLGSGCGGRAADTDAPPAASTAGTAGAAGTAGMVSQPSDCQYVSQFRCDSYNPSSHCQCDSSLPENSAACGGAAKFFCEQAVCPFSDCIGVDPSVDCHCHPDAPTTPSDCPGGPGQFECKSYLPEFRSCQCNQALPGNPSECASSASFQCIAYAPSYYACRCASNLEDEAQCNSQKYCQYSCASETPRYGCQCECVYPIK